MPTVSDEFVKHAQQLAEGAKKLLEKDAADQKIEKEAQAALKPTIEAVASVLVDNGFVAEHDKQAAIQSLSSHENCLKALQKTAMVKLSGANVSRQPAAEKMGSAHDDAAATVVDHRGEKVGAADLGLFRKLGFNV